MTTADKYVIPERRKNKSQQFLDFLYTKEKGCMGRGCKSWCKIIIFYIIFYALLAGFFAGMIKAFHETIPADLPKLRIGHGQAILVTPGLASVPIYQGKKAARMIVQRLEFTVSKPDTYAGYVAQLHEFIDKAGYSNESTVTVDKCDGEAGTDTCDLGLSNLGDCWDGSNPDFDFGYGAGQPCVLIKMNKLYNWIPEPYTENPDTDTFGNRFQAGHMPITCFKSKTQSKSDDVPIGDVSYFPETGIPASCYPFCGSVVPFKSPLTMVKFHNITKGSRAEVTCQLHAQNVGIAIKQSVGSITFQMEIEP